MKHSFYRRMVCAVGFLMILGLVTYAPAQKQNKKMAEAQKRSNNAVRVFNEIMSTADRAIPKGILDKAEAVAIFPGVVKAAFIFGGRGGQGIISRRVRGGWSEPVFFNLGGGSFGAQIGATKTDYIFLIMNDDGLRGLMEDKFEMGGEAGIAAGPYGREAAASTNATLDAGILSYSRSKGAFIGAAIKGAVIDPDNDLNRAVYGKKASELFARTAMMPLSRMPAAVRIVPQTLARYSMR
ncbi:MAG TPA: lipid-binding SYLF domain-containing protein [Pyrinomonadaceae bacterium]|nr:lipid-binding SYLF domain-containing protein [Pyrinomonadaceae bacterium]